MPRTYRGFDWHFNINKARVCKVPSEGVDRTTWLIDVFKDVSADNEVVLLRRPWVTDLVDVDV